MYAFAVSVLLYLFPPQVVAKLIVALFKRLAKSTRWTTVDDELAGIVEKSVTKEASDDGQGG
jgi:hypothetical protein